MQDAILHIAREIGNLELAHLAVFLWPSDTVSLAAIRAQFPFWSDAHIRKLLRLGVQCGLWELTGVRGRGYRLVWQRQLALLRPGAFVSDTSSSLPLATRTVTPVLWFSDVTMLFGHDQSHHHAYVLTVPVLRYTENDIANAGNSIDNAQNDIAAGRSNAHGGIANAENDIANAENGIDNAENVIANAENVIANVGYKSDNDKNDIGNGGNSIDNAEMGIVNAETGIVNAENSIATRARARVNNTHTQDSLFTADCKENRHSVCVCVSDQRVASSRETTAHARARAQDDECGASTPFLDDDEKALLRAARQQTAFWDKDSDFARVVRAYQDATGYAVWHQERKMSWLYDMYRGFGANTMLDWIADMREAIVQGRLSAYNALGWLHERAKTTRNGRSRTNGGNYIRTAFYSTPSPPSSHKHPDDEITVTIIGQEPKPYDSS